MSPLRPRIRFSRRRAGALLSALVLVAAALALALWAATRALQPRLARERVEAALASVLGRPVRVERVGLELWRGRVVLDGLAVAAGDGWADGVLLQARRLIVGVQLASLWRRELVLGVVLEQPAVRLAAEVGPPGRAWPPWVADRVVVGPLTVVLGALETRGAEVEYRAAGRDLALAATGLDARIAPGGDRVDVRLRVARLAASGPHGPLGLDEVSAEGALTADQIRLTYARGRLAGELLEVSGRIEDPAGAARLALDVRGRLALAVLARWGVAPAFEGTARLQGHVGGTAAVPTLSAQLAVPTLVVTVGGRSVEARRVQAHLTWDGRHLALTEATALTLGGRLHGSLSIPRDDPAGAVLSLQAERLELPALQRLAGRELGLHGAVSARLELSADLRRPLAGQGRVQVEASGVVLPAVLAPLGPGTVTVRGRLGAGGLDVERAEGRWAGAHLEASGRAGPGGAERLRVTLAGDLARLAALAGRSGVSGQARLEAEVRGPWTAPRVTGDVELAPLAVGGTRLDRVWLPFAYTDGVAIVEEGRVSLGPAAATLAARVALPVGRLDPATLEAAPLHAELRAPAFDLDALSAWLPPGWPVSGRVAVRARVEGTLGSWRVLGEANAPRLAVRGRAVEAVSVTFAADSRRVALHRVSARVLGLPLVASGEWPWQGTGRFSAEVPGAELETLRAPWPALQPSGHLAGRAEITVDAGRVGGTASLTAGAVTVAGIRLGDGRVTATLLDGRLQAAAQFPGAGVTATVRGPADGSPLAVHLEARDVDAGPVLARWVPAPTAAAARGSLVADLAVPPAEPAAARGSVRVEPLEVALAGETWRAQGPVLIERVPGATRISRAALASRIGSLVVAGSVEDSGLVHGTVRGRLPLDILPALHPGVRAADGRLDLTLNVDGRLPAPEAGGEATLSASQVVLAGLDAPLRDVEARLALAAGGLRLVDATARLSGGTLRARGDVTLRGIEVGGYRIELTARQVAVEPIEGLATVWDADLELAGTPGRGRVRGEARLLRGAYDRDLSLVRLVLERRPAAVPAVGGLNLDVRLALEDRLTVSTDPARLRVGGALQLQGTTAAPVVFGTLAAREGQLVFRGHRFELTHAVARFVDPRRIDPFLDVQATSRIQTYDVTLTITGRTDDLEVRLTSSPALPDEDLLALVAFGRTREQLARAGPGIVVGEAAGLLVRELFGVQPGRAGLDVLEVDRAPDSGQTTVRVGKQVSPRTLVVYSQGVEQTDHRRLRIEYQVVGPLAVAGEQDFRGGFGADILVRLRFR